MPRVITIKMPDDVDKKLSDYSNLIKVDGFEFNQSSFIVSAVNEKLDKLNTKELKTLKNTSK